MKKFRHLLAHLYERPVRYAFSISLAIGFAVGVLILIRSFAWEDSLDSGDLLSMMFVGFLVGLFLVSPLILTLYNILYLVLPQRFQKVRRAGYWLEGATILFGALCSYLYAPLTDVRWDKNWSEQLYNSELHTPIATWTVPTLIVIAAVALIGYLILKCCKVNSLPPLLTVIAISGMYLGAVLCILWIIQLIPQKLFFLCLYPFNLLLIAAKVIKEVILDFQAAEHPLPEGKAPAIKALHLLLTDAKSWPWLAVLCALPLLGILIAVLVLFGQAPDSIIQAWTQTSDWTFSQQVAPQNIYMDQHYLCTVAAGGHPKLVRPIREGKRHGHKVLVNRQLCVANAFEQLLEERIPRVHQLIRRIYDRYGYPIARHIRSPYVADAVWLLMKPLEWFFLAVLYLCDNKPENRIAIQYPHAPTPKQ